MVYFTHSRGVLFHLAIPVLLNSPIAYKNKWLNASSRPFITWGRKNKLINNQNLLFLEDGFLRSFGPGRSFQGLSIVVDKIGIYYDCTNRSALEHILDSKLLDVTSLADLVSQAKDSILSSSLSKYNHSIYCLFNNRLSGCIKLSPFKVLVVDQTRGDLSVEYGGASIQSFFEMLNAALAENPSATIYVKTHPEVTSGRKKGYLTHIQSRDRIVIIRDDVNPIDLIQKMDKVYVVTSQMGFEALMCGKPVVCFGVPWYAGWGLTDDRVKDSPAWKRRTKKRTVDELFAAAYIHYTRYLNPFTHKRGKIMDVINWLILQKKMAPNPFIRDFTNAKI